MRAGPSARARLARAALPAMVAFGSGLPLPAPAAPPSVAGPLAGAVKVAPEALGRVRGGFTSADGALRVSFGIDRALGVGGDSVPVDAGTVTLVQRGGGNVVAAIAPGAAAAAVIQNSLDGQTLRTLTTIDIQANSLQVQRAAALQSTLGGALAASLRR